MTILGRTQAVLQLAMIGEQQQPLTIAIQSPDRIHVRHGYEVLERGAIALTIGKLAQHIVGLVKNQVLVWPA
jgi:hypothetical protein